jgi:hypothetical protein
MLRYVLAALLGLISTHAQAGAGAFDKWLATDSPECVPVADIAKVDGVKIVELTPAQFQFTRALYVGIPPVSQSLPPGDSAIKASVDGTVMLAIVMGDKTCARFLAPDFIQKMIDEIERAPL